MSKESIELTDREKWFIGFILGRTSNAILYYMGLTKEEAEEFGNLYRRISKRFPCPDIPFSRMFINQHWDLVDNRVWKVTKRYDESEKGDSDE